MTKELERKKSSALSDAEPLGVQATIINDDKVAVKLNPDSVRPSLAQSAGVYSMDCPHKLPPMSPGPPGIASLVDP